MVTFNFRLIGFRTIHALVSIRNTSTAYVNITAFFVVFFQTLQAVDQLKSSHSSGNISDFQSPDLLVMLFLRSVNQSFFFTDLSGVDLDGADILSTLHSLYSMTFTALGKYSVRISTENSLHSNIIKLYYSDCNRKALLTSLCVFSGREWKRGFKGPVTRCNFSCNLQRNSTLKRCKFVTNVWCVKNVLSNCDGKMCLPILHLPRVAIALQVARKIAPCDRALRL